MQANSLILQDYEAIAAYDRAQCSPEKKAVLILDSSSCAAALGIYQENGRPQIAGIWNPDTETSFETLVNSTFKWSGHVDELKNAVRKYYLSERRTDLTVPGLDIPVSRIVSFCDETISGTLGIVFRSADAILEKAGISHSEIRILLTGSLAVFFPLEAVVRCHYSPTMPMMPDNRYVHYSDTAPILLGGGQIMEQFSVKRIENSVVWQILSLKEDGSTETMQIFLALEDTKVTDLETLVFADCGEIFACAGEELSINISGSILKIPVPDSLLQNGAGTVNLGLQYRDEKFYLLIRSSHTPTITEYPVNIRLKGKQQNG